MLEEKERKMDIIFFSSRLMAPSLELNCQTIEDQMEKRKNDYPRRIEQIVMQLVVQEKLN